MAAIIGCPANLFAAGCAWKFGRTRNPALLYQWFVFSMSLADFLFLAVVSPIQFAQYTFRVQLSRVPCMVLYITSHTSTVASSLSLLALNIDKFLAIYRPLYHASRLSGRRVCVVIVLSWIISLAWALFFMFGITQASSGQPCLLYVKSYGYYLGFAMVFFVAPTAMATVLSVFIAIVVKRQLVPTSGGSIGEEYKMEESPNCVRRNSRSLVNVMHIHRDSLCRARRITFVFTTTIWSFCTVIPYRLVYTMTSTMTKQKQGGWLFVFALILLSLMAANPLGNALITILTQRRFRQEWKRVWRRLSGGARKPASGDHETRTNARIPLLK